MKKNLKSVLSLVLASTILFSTSTVALASSTNDLSNESSVALELETAYVKMVDFASVSSIPLDMSLEEFVAGYNTEAYGSVEEYAGAYYSIFKPETRENKFLSDVKSKVSLNKDLTSEINMNLVDSSINFMSSSSSDDILWQYNTGTTLPRAANYSKYNLLNVVKKGDIIHESKGFFGITGHTAIVEGIYYSSTYNQYYIRVIEALSDGIVRSVFDDDRLDAKDASIYRVPSATSTKINAALSFAISQLGDSYSLDFQKDYDDQPDWYCSELVWASYKRQGIDIETTGFLNEPGITPRDIIRCSFTSKISYSVQ